MHPSITHRALVTYSNENTGEIRVKIPAVTGVNTEISLSKIGRTAINNIWVVPAVGEQIIVSADDDNMTNVFWIQTGQLNSNTNHLRNFAQFLSTVTQTTDAYTYAPIKFDADPSTEYQQGIRLTNPANGVITFDYEGYYHLQYSIQFENTHSQAHDAVVWVEYMGNAYPFSSTYITVPSSHGGVNGRSVMSVNLMGKAFAGDHIRLMWANDYNAVKISTINPPHIDVGEPPAPGVIATIIQVR